MTVIVNHVAYSYSTKIEQHQWTIQSSDLWSNTAIEFLTLKYVLVDWNTSWNSHKETLRIHWWGSLQNLTPLHFKGVRICAVFLAGAINELQLQCGFILEIKRIKHNKPQRTTAVYDKKRFSLNMSLIFACFRRDNSKKQILRHSVHIVFAVIHLFTMFSKNVNVWRAVFSMIYSFFSSPNYYYH